MIKFFVPLKPVAKARPRLGKFGRTYTPQKTKAFEQDFLWLARRYAPKTPLEGPIRMNAIFYFEKPKSAKGRIYPCVKPDCDNLIKAVTDSMNKSFYKDDAQIIDCRIQKRYAEKPGIAVSLVEVI